MRKKSGLVSGHSGWRFVGAAAAAGLLVSGCAGPVPTASREPLQFEDVETVFYGFNNPTERVSDRLMRLYGDDSVPLEMTAGQADESILHVEVRSDADDEQGSRGVRCFEYRLDHAMQQAHLEDLTTDVCSSLAIEGDS
jgi:predicted adenine nucleotide alpha hydrolase (AANH) superfamily ATPase